MDLRDHVSEDPKLCPKCEADALHIDESGQFVVDPLNYAVVCDECGWFAEHHSFDALWDWMHWPVEKKRENL